MQCRVVPNHAFAAQPTQNSGFLYIVPIPNSSKTDSRSLIGVCLPSERGVELPRVPHVPHEYLGVLPAAREDLCAVGREPDVRDAAALSGQEAEHAAVGLEIQSECLSARGGGPTGLDPEIQVTHFCHYGVEGMR